MGVPKGLWMRIGLGTTPTAIRISRAGPESSGGMRINSALINKQELPRTPMHITARRGLDNGIQWGAGIYEKNAYKGIIQRSI